jgi:hypothetical protein
VAMEREGWRCVDKSEKCWIRFPEADGKKSELTHCVGRLIELAVSIRARCGIFTVLIQVNKMETYSPYQYRRPGWF